MSIELLRSLIWTEFRLAVLFAVIIPLILLIWAAVKQAGPFTHLMVIYWRVASLLGISVYLMIDQNPLGFLTGFLALVLIPASLWFWVDLNEEIEDRRSSLKLAVAAWRWAITLSSLIGAALFIPYLRCGTSKAAIAAAECQVWLEPAQQFKSIFHAGTNSGRLGFMAFACLILYGLYFGYFLLFRLTKQGRSATGF
jgi:Protein of unknown function (DUF3177)